MKKLLIISAIYAIILIQPLESLSANKQSVINNYANIVYNNYSDTYKDAISLQNSINKFLDNPTDANLQLAKYAWLVARNSYGQIESYHFYERPIDFVDEENGNAGPEGRLNAWPVNEAYIDYVEGNPQAGIAQDKNVEITKETLSAKNQENDEAYVATGYHAIEFLL